MPQDVEQARRMLTELQTGLRAMVERDPKQGVGGGAVRVIDAAVSAARSALSDDPVVGVIADVVLLEAFAPGESLRSADVLLVVDVLLGALPGQDWGALYKPKSSRSKFLPPG